MISIKLSDVSKRYGYQWIIKEMNHTITAASITGVNGRNGSGKSTLLKILSGYLSPSSGKVLYTLGDKSIDTSNIYKHVSWVAPYIDLTMDYTMKEMFDLTSRFKQMKCGDYSEFIDKVQLGKQEGKYIKEYSSGMQQRLKLALAIMTDTPLLLLDEPTSYLDTTAILWYHDLLQSYLDRRTIVVASNESTDLEICGGYITL